MPKLIMESPKVSSVAWGYSSASSSPAAGMINWETGG